MASKFTSLTVVALLPAVVLPFTSCGPSRAELHEKFDRCIEYRVEPLWEQQSKIQDLDDYLYSVDKNETFTVSRFVALLRLTGIDGVRVDFEPAFGGDLSELTNEIMKEARAAALDRGEYFFNPDELYEKRTVDEWRRFLWNEIDSKVALKSDAAYLDCDKTYAERFGKAYADRFR